MKDDADRTAVKIFVVLVIIATIAWKFSKLYEQCADGCAAQGRTFLRLELNNIMSGTCICEGR